MIKQSISEMASDEARITLCGAGTTRCLFGTWLQVLMKESPQLRKGGQLQGSTHSSGSSISVPSSSPRVLSKGHHSLKKQTVLQLCKKHCFKRMFSPNLAYFLSLASSWYGEASSFMGNHCRWIIWCNNCCTQSFSTPFSRAEVACTANSSGI